MSNIKAGFIPQILGFLTSPYKEDNKKGVQLLYDFITNGGAKTVVDHKELFATIIECAVSYPEESGMKEKVTGVLADMGYRQQIIVEIYPKLDVLPQQPIYKRSVISGRAAPCR